MSMHPGALKAVASVLSTAIRPQPPMPFREWLAKNIILVDGPRKGELWSLEDAPYLAEIADCLSLEHPANLVTVRKAQQTGVSIFALAWSLYIAETAPDNVLYAVPGIDALQDINSGKLQPLIDAWQNHTDKRIIIPTTSRSGVGSTTYEKKFAGGALFLANANTVMDLSAKTCRYGVKDEVSKWHTLQNGADPEALFFGRFTAFRRQRTFKIFELSTPENDSGDELGEAPGHCRIDRSFRRSDQRFWHIGCVECGHEFWQSENTFHVDRQHPHKSVQVCPQCGHWISEMERVGAVRAGRYIASATGPDRHPGFHVDAFMSLMMSYEAIAEDLLDAEGKGEAGAKDFRNLALALPYQLRGNAPDHQRLMERREDYRQRIIPAEGLIFTAGGDVQHDGIYVEAVAFAEDRQSWTVDADFLPGATDDISSGAWVRLDEWREQGFKDAFGKPRKLDALAVDAGDGGRANQVYEWCRRRPDTYAVKGKGGRGVPAINPPERKSVNRRGKRRRVGGILAWPVGVWSLKAEFYGNLHKSGLAAGEPKDPPGYCHFGTWLGEEYFRQITAEYFDQRMVRGRLLEEWKKLRRDNHWLDCRIYAMAMAEHMGLTRMTADEWAALRDRIHPDLEPDLLHVRAVSRTKQAETGRPVDPDTKALKSSREAWKRR